MTESVSHHLTASPIHWSFGHSSFIRISGFGFGHSNRRLHPQLPLILLHLPNPLQQRKLRRADIGADPAFDAGFDAGAFGKIDVAALAGFQHGRGLDARWAGVDTPSAPDARAG